MNNALLKLIIIGLIMVVFVSCKHETETVAGPYLGTGIKIGEVTQSEAIVWVRLTENATRVSDTAPRPDVKYINSETGELVERKGRPDFTPVVTYPEGYDVKNIRGACPGANGKVRLKYKIAGELDWNQMDWQTVNPDKAFATQFMLSKLSAGQKYELLIESAALENDKVSASINGKFQTAPAIDTPTDLNFVVTTCTSYPHVDSKNGYKLYPNALKLNPEFFIHAGDILYYDGLAKTAELARYHWDRMYSYPNNIEFHSQIASYFVKDDHDTWMNDAFPGYKTKFMGDFTYEEGTQFFLEEVPMNDKTYRTVRWGKDLQMWLMEGRDYRSPNTMDDGPKKTIWGKEQIDWFKSTIEASNATYKLVISPTPIVGPDRMGDKSDNHANEAFSFEGDAIRAFIGEQKNTFTICGDRHWQYISKDKETGVVEFSVGAGSDKHAGGWTQGNVLPEHIYLNVVGGFMEVEISSNSGAPKMIVRHYNPDGDLLNEYVAESI